MEASGDLRRHALRFLLIIDASAALFSCQGVKRLYICLMGAAEEAGML
jgi:hypothetical protein